MDAQTPTIVTVAPGRALVAWGQVPFADIPRFQREARARIGAALARRGIEAGPSLTVSRRPTGDGLAIAPGVFVAAAFEPEDGLSIQEIPAGRAAHLRLEEPYDRLGQAWTRLSAWVAERALEPAGLNWEVYGDPAVPVTDLYALLRTG